MVSPNRTISDRAPQTSGAATPPWQRWVAAARRAWSDQRELQERLAIRSSPWTHDQVHWVRGELHGSVPPPAGSPGPVTAGGWCPCRRGHHPASM